MAPPRQRRGSHPAHDHVLLGDWQDGEQVRNTDGVVELGRPKTMEGVVGGELDRTSGTVLVA